MMRQRRLDDAACRTLQGGSSRPCVIVPVRDRRASGDVRTPRALRDYLADVCHESATPEHDRVRWLDR